MIHIAGFSPLINYLRQYETIYPGIEIWWEKRVIPDMASGTKVIFRFDRDIEVQALGVVDLKQGKLCHLSLMHAVRGTGLGKSILSLAIRELRYYGHNKIWCHGPENIVQYFNKWSNMKPVATLGTFGRDSVKDIMLSLPINSEV